MQVEDKPVLLDITAAITDPDIIKLIDLADKYICPACGKGIDEDECESEYLWRTGEITEAILAEKEEK